MRCDTKEPTDTASDDTSWRLKKELHKSRGTKLDRNVGLCVVYSPVTAKELDSGINVMQGSFTEGGNSILVLGALESEAAIQVTSFS